MLLLFFDVVVVVVVVVVDIVDFVVYVFLKEVACCFK